jgi:hypothetical protein
MGGTKRTAGPTHAHSDKHTNTLSAQQHRLRAQGLLSNSDGGTIATAATTTTNLVCFVLFSLVYLRK